MESTLQTQAFKMTRLSREKFPQGKFGDTVKNRVSDVDRGRCDSRNILVVIMEAELTKDLFRVGTKDQGPRINKNHGIGVQDTNSVHVQRVLLISQKFHQLISH